MNKIKWTGFLLGPTLFIITYVVLSHYTVLSPAVCKVLAVASWMVTWWVTEAVYVAITAILPMILFPLLGVFTTREATIAYADPVIYLFMGGFILALALEKHNLHVRIALNLIRLTGTSGNGIIAGFTISTALISMWISNTATAIMMLPIGLSITNLIKDELANDVSQDKNYRNFSTALMLCIAYASSIGGIATIIGTPPNVVMAGLYRQTYNQEITFLQWIMIGLPISITLLIVCYVVITRIIFPVKLHAIYRSKELITSKLAALGNMSKAEKIVIGIFLLTSISWIVRPTVNDWLNDILYADGVRREILNDTIIAMSGGLLMLIVPVDIKRREFILSWDDMKRLPWGILILFGGGMCLALALEKTGIINQIGDLVARQQHIGMWPSIILLTSVALFLTELMSNVALVSVFIPVVFGIANGLGYNALLVAMPVTFVASCAFMMPVSTPPNAILFGSGHIRQADMLKAGIVLNIFSLIIVLIGCSLLLG